MGGGRRAPPSHTYLHTIPQSCMVPGTWARPLYFGLRGWRENSARWDSSTSRVAPSRPQDSPKAPRPTLPLGSLRRGMGGRSGELFAKPTPKYHDSPAKSLEERSARGPLVGRLGSPTKERLSWETVRFLPRSQKIRECSKSHQAGSDTRATVSFTVPECLESSRKRCRTQARACL